METREVSSIDHLSIRLGSLEERDKKWFCSELIAAALEVGGVQR